MKLEPGRFYTTADGRRLGPAVLEGDRRGVEGRWTMSGHDYDDDGHATSGPQDVNDAVDTWLNAKLDESREGWEKVFDAVNAGQHIGMASDDHQFTKAPSVDELIGQRPANIGFDEFVIIDKGATNVSWAPTLNLRYAPKLQQLAAHRMLRAKELAQQIPNNCDDNIPRKVEELARSIVDLMADAPHNVIAAGTHITCENGHHIMTAGVDVSLVKPQDVSNWTDWQQPEPPLGDFLPLICAQCDAEWMRMSRDKRVQYHTEEGWRP